VENYKELPLNRHIRGPAAPASSGLKQGFPPETSLVSGTVKKLPGNIILISNG
jgi:hypothetical protein